MPKKSAFMSFAEHLQQSKNIEPIVKNYTWCVGELLDPAPLALPR